MEVDADGGATSHLHKRKRDFDDNGTVDANGAASVADDPSIPDILDSRAVKKLLLSFERRLRDNLAARMKHPDDPSRFADTEIALHEVIDRLRILAGSPDLYPDVLSLRFAPSVSTLLSHDNADIAADAAALLADLTDPDIAPDPEDLQYVVSLASELISNNVLELLSNNLSRLSEADPDEASAVYNTLAVIENLTELCPEVAPDTVGEKTQVLKWLLKRLKPREFDTNKQYASEILAILLQSSVKNQVRLGAINGVDGLLQAVAMYKSRDPKTDDEEEMVENLFNSLCCLLMPAENKERFVKAEGVELMIIIMKQKKLAYGSAVRVLDFALTRCPAACDRFVDVLGLKTAFAAFMGKIPMHKKNKKERFQEDLEERIISIIASLFSGLTKGQRRNRLLGKFVENECEKIDRLMEFFMRYNGRVKTESERLDSLDLDELEMDEDERYNRKLEAGLYTLQLLAVILGHLWLFGNSQMKTRIDLLLRQNKLMKQDVKNILQKYLENIGDIDGADEKERAKGRARELIAAL